MSEPFVYLLKDKPGFAHITTAAASAVLAALPEAVLVGAEARGPILEIPVRQDVAEVLADLRAPHMPPMVQDYDWKASFTPFPHQFRMAGLMSTHKRFFCLAEAGTGKTVAAVWALDYLKRIGRIKRACIIAPLSLLEDTWYKEFRNAAPHWQAAVIHGSAEMRRRKLAMPHDVAIINYDGVEIVYDQLRAQRYDAVVLDESTFIKNVNRRWKFCAGLATDAQWLWMLTATPTAQAPTDAYGQCRMMHPKEFKYTENAWKELTMRKVSTFRWVVQDDAAEKVQQAMQPAIYIRKRDVLKDLPPVTRQRRRIEPTTAQKKMMNDLKRETQLVAASGALITAVHAAALHQKLVQIASGVVYDSEGNTVDVDNTPRINELLEIVRETRSQEDLSDPVPNNKVLVFCAFTHTVASVTAALNAKGFAAEMVTGDTPAARRAMIFEAFRTQRKPDVIVAIADVMAHGLTLTTATATVWFTPITSNEKFTQACNRTDRPGQKYPMTMWELYGTDVERHMYDRLDERDKQQADVLSAYKQIVSFL